LLNGAIFMDGVKEAELHRHDEHDRLGVGT
jgi:hypothetical protein